jgi:hypothetical protein
MTPGRLSRPTIGIATRNKSNKMAKSNANRADLQESATCHDSWNFHAPRCFTRLHFRPDHVAFYTTD